MNSSGPGAGGATLSPPPVPPARSLRAVAFTPAVRGYPGGIADMAAEQDDLAAGGSGAGTGSGPGEPGAGATAGARRQNAPSAAPGTSVWQQSLAAWQKAGIDWLREARPAPAAEDRAAAEAELEHTQPIPVVPALGSPALGSPALDSPAFDPPGFDSPGFDSPVFDPTEQPAAGGRAAGPGGETTTAAAGTGTAKAGADEVAADEDVIVLSGTGATTTALGAAGTAPADPDSAAAEDVVDGSGLAATGPASAAADEDGVVPGATGAAAAASSAGAGAPVAGTDSAAAASAPAGTIAGGPQAAAAGTRASSNGAATKPGRRRPGRRVIIVAVATSAALLAGAIAGVSIAQSGPAGPTFGLVTPYPAAALADGGFAAQTAGPGMPPSLTGLADAGKTIVAAGSQGAGPLSVPLILVSQDGGQTWARAVLENSTAVGPGAVPALVVHGRDSWLVLGQHSAWTSADGRVWQAGPGVPASAGDKILGLARTQSGFIAVGENVTGPGGSGVSGPVLWTSADGRTWQRKSGAALTLGDSGKLDAGGGSMVSLRWAAYRAGTTIVGGEISRPVVKHRGKRKIVTNVDSPGLWRSGNGGVTWQPVKLPASHGATAGLAGLAATGSAFVVVRPGRARTGRRDAVAYVSGTGSTWRYAGKLISGRRAPLRVLTVAASGQAFVVSGTTGASRVAFVSARGRGWHKTADQGRAASTTVTGVTVAPGSVVVAAGSRHQPGSRTAHMSPYLLLTGTGAKARRTLVGTAALTAAGTADVAVNSLAAAGGEQVAAGGADGAPALWSATAAGHWVPSTVSAPASWSGGGSLASVTHGSAGWLAVGNAGVPSAGVAVTSVDGRTWLPVATAQLKAPGTALAQAAAGPSSYVVVGSAATAGGGPGPAAWYSAGLSTWTRATIPQPGPAGTGGAMVAVTADRSGFAAAGSSGTSPAVWTSRTGSAWQVTRLPLPAGTASAVLTQVTAVGGRVVAVGDAVRTTLAGQHAAGPVPFAAVSGDGGRSWREVVLHAPAGPATITALTAAGSGFVAAGLSGRPGDQGMLIWWSADGLSWRGGEPVAGPLPGRGIQQITALSAADGTLTGAGYVVTQSGEHPLRWSARYR